MLETVPPKPISAHSTILRNRIAPFERYYIDLMMISSKISPTKFTKVENLYFFSHHKKDSYAGSHTESSLNGTFHRNQHLTYFDTLLQLTHVFQ